MLAGVELDDHVLVDRQVHVLTGGQLNDPSVHLIAFEPAGKGAITADLFDHGRQLSAAGPINIDAEASGELVLRRARSTHSSVPSSEFLVQSRVIVQNSRLGTRNLSGRQGMG